MTLLKVAGLSTRQASSPNARVDICLSLQAKGVNQLLFINFGKSLLWVVLFFKHVKCCTAYTSAKNFWYRP